MFQQMGIVSGAACISRVAHQFNCGQLGQLTFHFPFPALPFEHFSMLVEASGIVGRTPLT